MKVLNFGSLNLDFVYSLDHIVKPGETISSTGLEINCGGKGLNQSVALARAGAQVFHAGLVGEDAGMLLAACDENGVDRKFIRTSEVRTGNAIIQRAKSGQNSIVLFGGANQENSKEFVDEVLSHFEKGDLILLQNEVNLLDYMIEEAYRRGMVIALNPSPYDEKVAACDLGKVTYFLMNEVEGAEITGKEDAGDILDEMLKRYPNAKIVLTLGKTGVVYRDSTAEYRHGIYDVPVVDTTAAGDTFTGFFLASVLAGDDLPEALRKASVASSIAVSKKGATASIPFAKDVLTSDLKLM